jgi:CHAT domain-containing protein
LGKVTGDGVFGLRRGFKKAGAQTLLMSLWKVDDAATRLLMSRFYDYLMEGVGKHEALRRAQQYLRTLDVETASGSKRRAFSARKKRAKKNSVKKLYQDPYYWAAFILLDAL